jgi:phosphatidylinositol alpha-1,6-mannosyltransferase
MRILMLNNEFPPLGGGTGTVNQAILQRLAGFSELEIDLVTSAEGKQSEKEIFSEQIKIHKVPVNRFNIHHASNQELLLYTWRAILLGLKLHRDRPYDLCFAWSAVPAGGSALVLRRLTGLRYLVRVCGPDIPGFEQRYGQLYKVLKLPIQAIWRGATVVVAKCQGEADMIHAVDPRIKTTLVPNGVDLERFQPGDPIPDSGPLRLLCVARLIERKGQHYLIRAVHQLVEKGLDVTLDLIGTGDAEAACRSLAAELNVAERVHFLGYIPREEIPHHYAQAHVFVLPSYNEGMSVATLEAMAAGLPVIITHTGGTAELVKEGVNGFVFNWGDVGQLSEYIEKLLIDRAQTRKMARAARIRAIQFTWEKPARQYLDIFGRLISQEGETTD